MNLPNLLTFSRVPILFLVVGFLYLPFQGAATIALLFFVLGALTDWADGYYARKMGLVSDFGKLMDALTDKIFVLGLFILLLVREELGIWALPLLLLILCREFLITGLRLIAASTGTVLAAEKSGKYKTIAQMLSLSLLFLALALREDFLFLPDILSIRLQFAGQVLFILASMLTIASGAQYMIKYRELFSGKGGSAK